MPRETKNGEGKHKIKDYIADITNDNKIRIDFESKLSAMKLNLLMSARKDEAYSFNPNILNNPNISNGMRNKFSELYSQSIFNNKYEKKSSRLNTNIISKNNDKLLHTAEGILL
jgi:hypothetical protein